jgi:hypothetical protein
VPAPGTFLTSPGALRGYEPRTVVAHGSGISLRGVLARFRCNFCAVGPRGVPVGSRFRTNAARQRSYARGVAGPSRGGCTPSRRRRWWPRLLGVEALLPGMSVVLTSGRSGERGRRSRAAHWAQFLVRVWSALFRATAGRAHASSRLTRGLPSSCKLPCKAKHLSRARLVDGGCGQTVGPSHGCEVAAR